MCYNKVIFIAYLRKLIRADFSIDFSSILPWMEESRGSLFMYLRYYKPVINIPFNKDDISGYDYLDDIIKCLEDTYQRQELSKQKLSLLNVLLDYKRKERRLVSLKSSNRVKILFSLYRKLILEPLLMSLFVALLKEKVEKDKTIVDFLNNVFRYNEIENIINERLRKGVLSFDENHLFAVIDNIALDEIESLAALKPFLREGNELVKMFLSEKISKNLQITIDSFELFSNEEKELIKQKFETLPEREQDVIKRFFGLYNHKQETLEEISLDYSLKRERIRQIKEKALRRLRHSARLGTMFNNEIQENRV